jgi:beta-barrel assembly-enhancing protease
MTAEARFAARYYDGETARSQDVSISLTTGQLTVMDAGGAAITSWQADRIVFVEKPRTGEPVRIGLEGTTARLIVQDERAADALLAIAPKAVRAMRTNRKAVAKVAAWVVAAGVALTVIVLVIIPLLSSQLAQQTPQSLKTRIGAAAMSEIVKLIAYMPGETKQARYCHSTPGLSALADMTTRILSDMKEPPRLNIVVIDANLVNAFALPGGYVVVTSGLIAAAGSPEEIAGVLSHEIGHVFHQHPTQAIYRTTAVSLLISAMIGDFSGGILVTGIAEWALNSSYSRKAERAADIFAIERLNAANIDGAALMLFFDKISEKSESEGDMEKLPGLPSTHPRTAERIAFIKSTARGTGKVLSPTDWDALKQICAETGANPRLAPIPVPVP